MKLIHKGIALVLVPVTFEFAFVGALFYMLQQSELEVKRAEKARQVISHLNQLQRQLIIFAGNLPSYQGAKEVSGTPRRRLAQRLLKEEFRRLRASVGDDPKLSALADDMRTSIDEMSIITEDLKHAWSAIRRYRTRAGFKKGQGLFSDFNEKIDAIWAFAISIEEESPMRQAENRERMKWLLLVGLLLNVSIAVALAFYFNRTTVSRLSVVMDNARRLADRKPLNQRLEGDDEIALLDNVFTKMAKDLETMAENERSLLINAVDVICSLHENGTITDISPSCRKVWGYEPSELIAAPFSKVLEPQDASLTMQHIATAKDTGKSSSFENRIRRKDGRLIDMLWSLKWLPEEKTFFCVAHDNSERKATERMKREFISMLSHDLRSPLSSVQAFLTMVNDKSYGSLDEIGMAKISHVQSTVSWLIEMISDLLDIDKIEAGLSELDLEIVSLRAIVDRADDALEGLSEQAEIDIILPTKDAEVRVDSDMFLRVVTNLMSNAIKFSPKGSRVDVQIENIDGIVELRVVDRGIGIRPEEQATVFERFRQVGDASDRTAGRSSGLGLAVSKAIVEQHYGTIGVRSVHGEGSTFWVRLPAAEKVTG